MNGQPPVQPPKKEHHPSQLGTLLLQLLRALLHNWPYKLLSIFLSVLLWAGLITQDPDLTREKSFHDVSVTITGSDAMKRNGFIVLSDLSAELDDVDLRVNVPQKQYQTAKASNYSVRVDLSQIKEAGRQSVALQTTNSSVYGTVTEVKPTSVVIEVDDYITRYRIPVRTKRTGNPPDGFYASAPSVDSSVVTISGPRSIVDGIICAEVTVDMAMLPAREGMMRMALPIVLLNANNEPVESDLLEVTSQSVLLDSVVVSVNMYTARSVSLTDTGLVIGTPAYGYEVKSISMTPESVLIAGAAEEIEALDIVYADNKVDVTGKSASFHERVRLRQPEEVKYVSASTCTVAVEIGPVMQSRTFENIRLGVTGVGNGLTAELGEKFASVTLTGPMLWINGLKASDVELLCDVTNLLAGSYTVPVVLSLKNNSQEECSVDVRPESIPVTITAK